MRSRTGPRSGRYFGKRQVSRPGNSLRRHRARSNGDSGDPSFSVVPVLSSVVFTAFLLVPLLWAAHDAAPDAQELVASGACVSQTHRRSRPESRGCRPSLRGSGRVEPSVGSLLDVNVLVALLVPEHEHHAAAQDWFAREAGSNGWATCAVGELGVIRCVRNSLEALRAYSLSALKRLMTAGSSSAFTGRSPK
jgi:hypothetical protein